MGAGSACPAGQPAFKRAYRIRGARGFLWAVGTSYNEQALLRKAVCFVWAVTGVRTTPPVRAEVYAGSTRPRLCAAIWRRGILWEAIRPI